MRLIDADALLKGKQDHTYISTHLIWNAPTVDAEPIRHGKWEYDVKTAGFKCTECGHRIWSMTSEIASVKYCPYCGAKMNEELKILADIAKRVVDKVTE